MKSSVGRKPSATRACIGLALLGGGLAILMGATPHEDFVVGIALAIFGAVIVATAPIPNLPAAPPVVLASVGAALVVGMVGYNVAFHAAMDVTKFAIIAFGVALCVAAPFSRRLVTLRGRFVRVGSLVTLAAPAVGAPLAVWALQAAFKSAVGSTPLEAFIRVGLLVPLRLLLVGLGLNPTVQGQTISYATPHGPLALEVGAACAGIQAMALFGGVLAIFLWAERPPGRRLAIWSVIGIAGVYLANLLRLATLTLVGYQWGTDALLRVHADAGWMFFVAWAMLFAWLAKRSRTDVQTPPPASP